MMKTSVQLANTTLTPVAHNGPDMHRHTEAIASGMLDEEELFYVDPASGVDDFGCRFGHGYLDSTSLGAIRRAIAVGQMPKAESERSGRETEATSRSSSLDMENSWRASQRTDVYPRISPEIYASTTVAEGATTTTASAPIVTPAGSSHAEMHKVVTDPCSLVFEKLRRVWDELTGQRTYGNPRVEYICRHWASITSIKTFSYFESDLEVLRGLGVVPGTFTFQIPSFRVVSTIWGQHAEYEVRVVGGERQWTSWRRFSDFKVMAVECAEFDSDCAIAWARVLMAQPTRRCLNREYLVVKCNLLEAFLKQVMFSMATPTLLIQFLTKH